MLHNPDKINRRYIYSALIIYWIFLLLATSLPSSSLPDISQSDKLSHFGAYAVLSVLLTAALLVQNRNDFVRKSAFYLSVLFAALYGLIDEIHQMFIPGRNCEFLDWVADFSGAVTGTLVIYFLYRFEKKIKKVN